MDNKQKSKVKKPQYKKTNIFAYSIIVFVSFLLRLIFCVRVIDRKELKEVKALKAPVLAIANHLSAMDFVFMTNMLFPKRLSFVVARHLYYNDSSSWALKIMSNSIPKRQFVADYECVKSIKKMIDKGISVGLYPEGRVSIDGTESNLEPNIAKLIKWLNVPVVFVYTKGGYLAMPRYNLKLNLVKIEISPKVLFTKEDIASLSVNDIHNKLQEMFKYNEFVYQQQNRISIKSKQLALGLNTLLYKCPKCYAEFKMESHTDKLHCTACGNTAQIDKHGKIEPLQDGVCYPRIDLWYKFQTEEIQKEIQASDNYQLICEDMGLALNDEITGNFTAIERGRLTLSKDGFIYEGESGQKLEFPISPSPSISFVTGTSIDFFRDEFIYRMCFDKDMMSTKYNIATELLHKKYYN